MWNKIQVKKDKSSRGNSPEGKQYHRTIPLNQSHIRAKSRESRSRENSFTEKRKPKDSISNSRVDQNSPTSLQYLTSPYKHHVTQPRSTDNFSAPKITITKDPQCSPKVVSNFEQSAESVAILKIKIKHLQQTISSQRQQLHKSSSQLNKYKVRIDKLQQQLQIQKQKNCSVVPTQIDRQLRKCIQMNMVYDKKIKQLKTRMEIMKNNITNQLILYWKQNNIIIMNLVGLILTRNGEKQKYEMFKISQQRQKQDEISTIAMLCEPEQKLMKIMQNIKKIKLGAQKKALTRTGKPTLNKFIQDLNNYNDKKDKKQDQDDI